MIIINTKVLRYITQTKALKMNGLQWLVWPWAYDQVGSLMDGWGSGAYEMRQYTHLANATISKNISYNILQILSLYFREAPFWKAIRVCGHWLFSTFNYIHVITLVCVRCQIFMRFNSSCFLLQEGHVQFHFCVAATSLYLSTDGGVILRKGPE